MLHPFVGQNDAEKANSSDTKMKNHITDGEKLYDHFLAYSDTCLTPHGDQRIPAGPVRPSKTKFSKTRTDIYQIVTDLIITTLEVGVKP